MFAKNNKYAGLRHAGGVFIDAISVCFPGETGASFQKKCVRESEWVAATLKVMHARTRIKKKQLRVCARVCVCMYVCMFVCMYVCAREK